LLGGLVGLLCLVALPFWWWREASAPVRDPFATLRRYPSIDLEALQADWRGGETTFLSADGRPLAAFTFERCQPIFLESLPSHVVDAFVAAEHAGACPMGNSGSLRPLLNALELTTVHGLSPTLEAELCTSLRDQLFGVEMDQCFQGILLPTGEGLAQDGPKPLIEAWLNLVDMGGGEFGIERGAQAYFGIPARKLSPDQAALLAVVATRPDLRGNQAGLKKARNALLDELLDARKLSLSQYQQAVTGAIPRRPRLPSLSTNLPGYMTGVLEELEHFIPQSVARRQGLAVFTAFESSLQRAATTSIEKILQAWVWKRHKEVESLTQLMEDMGAAPEELTSEEAPPGSLFEVPDGTPSVSVMSIEPLTGRVRMLLDVCEEELTEKELEQRRKRKDTKPTWRFCEMADVKERSALYRKRQPGSAFKPFLYATALEKGLLQADTYVDAPFSYIVEHELWSPKNHKDKYFGRISARKALAESLNSVAIQLIFKVKPEEVKRMAQRLGVKGYIQATPALALGSPLLTLREMVQAYSVFASMGRRVDPRFIDRVEDQSGRSLPWPKPGIGEQVLRPALAYTLVDMLREVIASGTATRARKLGMDIAGKTGTSNESQNVWFMGFSPKLVTGVWMGFDDRSPLGGHETGGTLALPIWMEVMKEAARISDPGNFEIPTDIEFEARDLHSGRLYERGVKMAVEQGVREPVKEDPPDESLTEEQAEAFKAGELTEAELIKLWKLKKR
jgi:penicillin-binding protein 1A